MIPAANSAKPEMLHSRFIAIAVNDTYNAPFTQVVQLSTARWIEAVIYHRHIFDAPLQANASGAPQRQTAPRRKDLNGRKSSRRDWSVL
jgi:hypothetical protein